MKKEEKEQYSSWVRSMSITKEPRDKRIKDALGDVSVIFDDGYSYRAIEVIQGDKRVRVQKNSPPVLFEDFKVFMRELEDEVIGAWK